MILSNTALVFSALVFTLNLLTAYTAGPSWETLDKRPLPGWYDEAKFGIFLHWGLFSVPSFGTEWFWEYWHGWHYKEYESFINKTERTGFTYTEYASRFLAELYRPKEWAEIFAKSGAQYIVLTSKHHEGFCNWNSTNIPTTWNWNVMDVGPKRDLLGELSVAVKNATSPHTKKLLKFGVYHSLYEWFNPLYLQDKRNNFQTQTFVDLKSGAELYDLVNKYQPELIWSDGEWETHSTYWKATEFLEWYATKSPVAETAVWNDRWGNDTLCKHGGFLTCTDRYQPDGYVEKKWEDALTIDKTSWGLNRNASYSDYFTVKELVDKLIVTISLNGNMLLNVGPAADGTLHPIFVDRLMGMGDWLAVNGEAVYGTRPWKVCQNETSPEKSVYYVRKSDPDRLYVHVTQWPKGNILDLDCPTPTADTKVRMLGLGTTLSIQPNLIAQTSKTSRRYSAARQLTSKERKPQGAGLAIQLPALTPDIIPCQHAWVLEMTSIGNL